MTFGPKGNRRRDWMRQLRSFAPVLEACKAWTGGGRVRGRVQQKQGSGFRNYEGTGNRE